MVFKNSEKVLLMINIQLSETIESIYKMIVNQCSIYRKE